MLEDAKGINCQSSNFCKTVGVLAQGTKFVGLYYVITHFREAQNAIELIEYGRESGEVNYAQRIQTFHRFLIEHMSQEGNTFPHNPIINTSVDDSRPPAAPVTQLFGIDGRNLITCLDCNATREKEMMTHVIDLTYLRKASFQDSFRWWLSNTDCGSQTLMSPNPLWISRQFCAIHYSVILHTKRHVKFANNLPRSPRVAQFPPKIFHLYWR